MQKIKVVYVAFPEKFENIEYIKDIDILFVNLSFRKFSEESLFVPLKLQKECYSRLRQP